MPTDERNRCWPTEDPLLLDYHDIEWGTPLHDDRKLFEFLVLEGFQAGLSWLTVLRKREAFRRAFDGFDYEKVASYGKRKVNSLLGDAAIIRNRLKIEAAISNAGAFMKVREETGSFDEYIWRFTGGKQIQNALRSFGDMQARTGLSDRISADLKARGFKFAGSTIVYAHMQATGMVNDHLVTCFRYKELAKKRIAKRANRSKG